MKVGLVFLISIFFIKESSLANKWMSFSYSNLALKGEILSSQRGKSRRLFKVNSVQKTCAKCFAVHILEFEILKITWKKWNKEHHTLSFQFFTNRFNILMFFVLFFHVVWKISNFNLWTGKHLAHASCTELTLLTRRNPSKYLYQCVEAWKSINATSELVLLIVHQSSCLQ